MKYHYVVVLATDGKPVAQDRVRVPAKIRCPHCVLLFLKTNPDLVLPPYLAIPCEVHS